MSPCFAHWRHGHGANASGVPLAISLLPRGAASDLTCGAGCRARAELEVAPRVSRAAGSYALESELSLEFGPALNGGRDFFSAPLTLLGSPM